MTNMEEYEPKDKVEGGLTPKGPIWNNMNLKLRLRGGPKEEYEPKVEVERGPTPKGPIWDLLQDLVEYEPAVERGHQVWLRVAPGRDELTISINTPGKPSYFTIIFAIISFNSFYSQ